ncbi:MAG TPA: ABC transporter ATP-binding protein [Streptosporangiaceae bacterium]|nr:ABC transporter ATP-binding protein [Streptosporangiaceae bacterium]
MTTLTIDHLRVRYRTGRRLLTAVDDVSLRIPAGHSIGLVGESGSGKSTLARAIVGLAPVAAGRILLGSDDVTSRRNRRRRQFGRHVQLVFQSPDTSLNPRMRVAETIGEALAAYRQLSHAERAREISRLLDIVALEDRVRDALPRELSGGQRQRVAIARALAVKPEILIADEVTSALDVSVQGAVLNLLSDLRRELGISLLFITHNLSIVRYVCDEVAMMYLGRLVESGASDDVLAHPEHPYTTALVSAALTVRAQAGRGIAAPALGEPPDPGSPPGGCRFHPRCPVGPIANPDRTHCLTADPWPGADQRRHRAACHFARQEVA